MIFTRKVSRPIFFLLFILALSISAVASTTQAATTTMLHAQRTHLPSPQPFSIANDITSGPDGKLWFSLIVFPASQENLQGTSKIGQIDPSTHLITESQPLPNPQCVPNAITTGSDGKLWFTEYYQIGTITIGDNITEYPLPSGSIGNLPDQITGGPDNNLWFTEFSGNNIGRITTN